MESERVRASEQLDALARQRDSLREELTLPGWFYLVWGLVLATPALGALLPTGWLLVLYVPGSLLTLLVVLYQRRRGGLRLDRKRTFTRKDAVQIAVTLPIVAGVFALAVAVHHPWPLLVTSFIAVAMAVATNYRHRREFPLRDEGQ